MLYILLQHVMPPCTSTACHVAWLQLLMYNNMVACIACSCCCSRWCCAPSCCVCRVACIHTYMHSMDSCQQAHEDTHPQHREEERQHAGGVQLHTVLVLTPQHRSAVHPQMSCTSPWNWTLLSRAGSRSSGGGQNGVQFHGGCVHFLANNVDYASPFWRTLF